MDINPIYDAAAAARDVGNADIVNTGGGIAAVIVTIGQTVGTIFVDPLGDGYVTSRHEDENAFWECATECPTIHTRSSAGIATALRTVKVCEGSR